MFRSCRLLIAWGVIAWAAVASAQAPAGPTNGAPRLIPAPEVRPRPEETRSRLRELTIRGPEATIRILPGQAKLITFRKLVSRAVVGNPEIADVSILTGREVNLVGLKVGATTLFVTTEDNTTVTFLVQVGESIRPQVDVAQEERLRAVLGQIFPNAYLKVRVVGRKVILEGEVKDARTMAQVLTLVRTYLATVTATTLSRTGEPGTVATDQSLNVNAYPTEPVNRNSKGIGVNDLDPNIVNLVRITGAQQVLLKVKICQLNRTALRTLGIDFNHLTDEGNLLGTTISSAGGITASGSLTGRGLPGVGGAMARSTSSGAVGTATLFGIFDRSRTELFIDALRTNGMGKVLAEPDLVALDGQEAAFNDGGRTPVFTAQPGAGGASGAITVQYIPFGTGLHFTPTIIDKDLIRLQVEPQVSELGAPVTVGGSSAPTIIERTASTTVELRQGQTLAIAGLVQTRMTATTARIPLLGDIPGLGAFFSQNSFNRVEDEILILVTPILVSPMDCDQVPPVPGDQVYEPNDLEFFVMQRIEGKTGKDFRSTVWNNDPAGVMKYFKAENAVFAGDHGHGN